MEFLGIHESETKESETNFVYPQWFNIGRLQPPSALSPFCFSLIRKSPIPFEFESLPFRHFYLICHFVANRTSVCSLVEKVLGCIQNWISLVLCGGTCLYLHVHLFRSICIRWQYIHSFSFYSLKLVSLMYEGTSPKI